MSKSDRNNGYYMMKQYPDNKIVRDEFEYLLENIENHNGVSDLRPALKDTFIYYF